MPFLFALLLSFPFAYFAWRRTDAYVSVRAAGAAWPRTAAARAALGALAFACAVQGAWTAWDEPETGAAAQPGATVFLVDASASMLVPDAPRGATRLNYALDLASAWMEKHPGSPAALVAFGASARTQAPRTTAGAAMAAGAAQTLADAPLPGPEFFPGGVAEAVRRAGKSGRVVLLSDGGDPEDGPVSASSAKAALEKAGATLVAAAVGTAEGGRIPLRVDLFGETQYKKFGGRDVVARAAPERLRDWSRASGGDFLEAADVPDLPAPGAGAGTPAWPWALAAALAALASAAPVKRHGKKAP